MICDARTARAIPLQMLMGTTVSAYEQTMLSKGGGVCTDKTMDYSPMSQPCANDWAKQGMYSKDNTITRLEHLRPGMYSGIKGGYDTFWKVPNYGNP